MDLQAFWQAFLQWLQLAFQLSLSGVALGFVYGMVAMGMVLIYRAVGVMNFAQGDFLMMGGYIYYTMCVTLGLPIWLGLPLTAVILGIMGIVFQWASYWPLRNAQTRAIIVSFMGASIALKEIARLIWRPYPLLAPKIIEKPVEIFGAFISGQYLAIIVVAIVLMILVYLLLEKTYVGNIMQATAQDQYTASLMGIPVFVSISLTFMIAIALAGICGALLTPQYQVSIGVGGTAGVKAFAAIVIGGFGSVPGAILGGIIVGLVEVFGGVYISTTYQLALIYIVLVFFLMFRPQGIFGGKIQEKA
ncbi:MAG: branched-chain amino acid ABC transporter permease [Christensenellales bacterium]|jgi:branched-chain amino acid transport system permease protein